MASIADVEVGPAVSSGWMRARHSPHARAFTPPTPHTSQDPLRPKQSGWDAIPLMHVPRIIAAISNPPPPPLRTVRYGPDGVTPLPPGASPTSRPQTMVRFKRVVQQSAMAMQLLNRVNDALQVGFGVKYGFA